jgi:hypothetical protein
MVLWTRWSVPLGAALALSLIAGRSAADDSADYYCPKAKAKAAADAAVLIWPRVLAQGLHFPSDASSVGPTFSVNMQIRLGLSTSISDFWKGRQLANVAEADCELHETAELLQRVVVGFANQNTVPALRAQRSYLEAHQEEWKKTMDRGRERVSAGAITVLELQDLSRIIASLDRKLEIVRGEVKRAEPELLPNNLGSFKAMVETYVERSMRLEREADRLRAVDPWSVKVNGGIIPVPGETPTWYGSVDLSYSLGGISEQRNRARYLRARDDELRSARYELPARVEALRATVREQIAQAQRELKVVESEIVSMESTENALRGSEATRAENGRVLLTVQRLVLESDRIFLTTLVASLRTALEESDEPVSDR